MLLRWHILKIEGHDKRSLHKSMSIPSVSFKNRSRTPGNSRPVRRTQGLSPSSPLNAKHPIRFSDSDSDDLPTLSSKPTKKSTLIEINIESDSSEETDSDPTEENRVDWNSYKKEEEEEREKKHSAQISPPRKKKGKGRTKRPVRRSPRKVNIDQPLPPPPEKTYEAVADDVPKQHKSDDESDKDATIPTPVAIEQTVQLKIKDPEPELQTYQIAWKMSGITANWKRDVRMTQNDVLVYKSKPVKTNLGRVHIICTGEPICENSRTHVGTLKQHESGNRFTLYTAFNDGDGRSSVQTETLGISFLQGFKVDLGNSARYVRVFRFVMPPPGTLYKPRDKKENLSRIAKCGSGIPNGFVVHQSQLPFKGENDNLRLDFGNNYVISSVKNFIVRDSNGNVIFMMFKSSADTSTLKFMAPLTPLTAFSIALCIVTSIH